AVYISTVLRPACPLGRLLRGVLLIAALVAAWPNMMAGWLSAQGRDSKMASFERDLLAGVPPIVLADHYSRAPLALLGRQFVPELTKDIRMLKRAGVGHFRNAHDDPVYQTLNISPENVSPVGWLTYSPRNSRHVYAIR